MAILMPEGPAIGLSGRDGCEPLERFCSLLTGEAIIRGYKDLKEVDVLGKAHPVPQSWGKWPPPLRAEIKWPLLTRAKRIAANGADCWSEKDRGCWVTARGLVR